MIIMKKKIFTVFMFAGMLLFSCENLSSKQNQVASTIAVKTATALNDDSTVYKTENLIIQRLSNHVYSHTSFLNTDDFGKVACNGMIIINENEAIIFDTPSDTGSAGELIKYVVKNLESKILAVIPTHFHEDCVGGLEKFNEYNIPAYASNKTIELLKNENNKFSKPIVGFEDSLALNIGDEKVYAEYFGEGHTKDNIIGSFPEDKVIFGGCLIKELNANKGYLGDANMKEWPKTVNKLKQKYPETKIVIPGHGKSGGTELFDYTIKLFE